MKSWIQGSLRQILAKVLIIMQFGYVYVQYIWTRLWCLVMRYACAFVSTYRTSLAAVRIIREPCNFSSFQKITKRQRNQTQCWQMGLTHLLKTADYILRACRVTQLTKNPNSLCPRSVAKRAQWPQQKGSAVAWRSQEPDSVYEFIIKSSINQRSCRAVGSVTYGDYTDPSSETHRGEFFTSFLNHWNFGKLE